MAFILRKKQRSFLNNNNNKPFKILSDMYLKKTCTVCKDVSYVNNFREIN